MTPQQKRVLAASRSYQGTCSADWSDALGADGKGKILRVPARIEELEEEHGCVFEVIGRRNKTKVWRLVSGPVSEGAVVMQRPGPPPERATAAPCETDRLFEPATGGQYSFADQEKAVA